MGPPPRLVASRAARRARASGDGGCDASWRIRRDTWNTGPSSVMPCAPNSWWQVCAASSAARVAREARRGGARAQVGGVRVPRVRGDPRERRRGVEPHVRVGERVRDRLELADRAPELLARARVRGGGARRARRPRPRRRRRARCRAAPTRARRRASGAPSASSTRPHGSPPSVSTGAIAPRGCARWTRARRRARGSSRATGANGSSGGVPSATIHSPCADARALLLVEHLRGEEGRRERAREHRRAERLERGDQLARAAVALRCREREHAELGELAPERARQRARGLAHDRLGAALGAELRHRVGDRLLRVVEREVEAQEVGDPALRARSRAGAPTRRRARGAAPARRMLNTCRSCSRVKPIAPVSWCVSRNSWFAASAA